MALLRDIDRINLTNGTVCFVLSLTAPLAVLLAASRQAGLSEQQISGIVFAGYGIGGILTIVCSLVTRKPYAILWTIPGVTLLGGALDHMTLPEAAGAFVVSGILAIALGASGCMAYGMRLLPTPIVMGMLAGVFLPYGVGLFPAFAQEPSIGLATVVPFIVASAIPVINRCCPPLLAAMVGGGIYLAFSSDGRAYNIGSEVLSFTTPEMFAVAKMELQDRAGKSQTTDVVHVDAEVLDLAKEGERQVVSVRFHGQIREDIGAPAEDFDEIWHLTRFGDNPGWSIAGIQQRH